MLPDDAGAITLTPADINAVSVEDVANIRGAFRINVTYSGGVYSADKTFDEIKAAYDAGQQPYVVQTGGDTGVVYTFAVFTSQFVSFERYLIFGDTLKTVRLRIFPYTLENGSNIDRQTEAFDVASTGLPGAVRYDITQALSDTEKAQARANIGAGTSNFDGQYSSLTGQPTIPTKTSDLTNDSGFGTYSKPAGGIPKADLAEAVQTSLGKADTALQTHQSLTAYRTAAAQDVIDNTKLTDAPTDGKVYARKNGSWSEVAGRTLIAGSGITIIESEDGDIIQSDASGGGGIVSFVDVAGGAPIAQFTLNQTQDCEINVNDLIQTPLSNNYRTKAAQDAIDATKQDKLIAGEGITIAADGKTISSSGKVSSVNGKTGAVTLNAEDIIYAKESQKLDATIAGLKAADIQTASDISELQTADASLDSRITAIETGDTPVTLYIYWGSVVSGGRVSLTKDGAAMSVADFISKMQSGAKIIIGENNDTDSESSGFSNYRYKITDSTTASLAFDVANSFNGSNRTIIISGSSSTDGLMTGYQDIDHDDLSDYSPLPEGSTPASKAWVENYVAEKATVFQSKSITDSGGHFTSDTVEGALQEIGAELAGINTLLGSGIQISFTIDGDPFSAVSGETWKEWIGGYSRVISEISGLTLYCSSDDGIILADEAGVNALGLNDVWVHGNETIVSGATYAIIPCGG